MGDNYIPPGAVAEAETSTTLPPQPPPEQAAPGPAEGEAPPEPPPQEAAPEAYPPADAPATSETEAGYVPVGAAAPDTGEVIPTEGSTHGDLSGEPIETPVAAVGTEPGPSYVAPVGDEATGQDLRSQNPDTTFEPVAVPTPEGQGPLQQATNALGQLIAPVTEQLPEPVQNLTDIVGQPVGGALDATQSIANELGQGDIPGAIGAGLGALSGPWARGVQQVGADIAAGRPAVATLDQVLSNPAEALTWVPGLASRYGPAPAIYGTTQEDWFNALPPEQQASLAAQGGEAMNQAWLQDIGSSPVPPPQLSNPFDAATSGNPLERAGQVAGALPEFGRGWFESGKQGTLAPFVVSQAQNIVEDPLFWLDRAGVRPGEFVQSRTLNAARKIPVVAKAETAVREAARPLTDLFALSPAEAERKAAEDYAQNLEEYGRAGLNQLPTEGWPTGQVPTPGEPISLYHGTDVRGLNALSAEPPTHPRALIDPDAVDALGRASGNPMSQLGVFMTTDPLAAGEYADLRARSHSIDPRTGAIDRNATGVVYEAESPVRNPARFDFDQFYERYSDQSRSLTVGQDVRDLKRQLILQGHDGIVLTDAVGNVKEVVSFRDVNAVEAQRAVRAAYASAPIAYQDFVRRTMAPDPHFYRGVTASLSAIENAKAPTAKRLKFRNGWNPENMTGADVWAQLNADHHRWLAGMDREGTPLPWTTGTDRRAAAWQKSNKLFNPNGDLDPRVIKGMMAGLQVPGARVSAAQRRADFLVQVMTDATQNAKTVEQRTKTATAWGDFTNAIRQSTLFNLLNIPRYIAQNLTGNSINQFVRGGGLRPVWDTWTDLKEMTRIYGHLKEGTPTTLNSVAKHTGAGEFANMLMTQQQFYGAQAKNMPRALKRVLSLIAPEWGQFMASVPDVHSRHAVAMNAIQDGYRELNKTLAPRTYERFRKQMPTMLPPLEKFHQLALEFQNENRHIPDGQTGELLTGLVGNVERFVPMWNPDAWRVMLKDRLFEDVPANQRPSAGQINRAVNDLTGPLRDDVRQIFVDAKDRTDYSLHEWRNTVLDEKLANITLFHYFMTRQGGFYLSEMAKHPWVAAEYGRMMAEMEAQNEALGGPMWMTGWFQFQQSVGGFSTWFSPVDFISSALTMAEWQLPDDPSKYEDLTRIGKAMQQFPLMFHPLLQGVAYGTGLLGPDARPPNLTGTETFGAKAIQLLNLANSEGAAFMKPFNAMGIGVDQNGDVIPLAPRPLSDLYATAGHYISQALMPLTGLPPVEAVPSWGSFMADVQAIGEQETRAAHPEWDDGSVEGQMQIESHVTDVLMDPGSAEYTHWYQLASSEPFQLGAGTNPILAAAARIASPIQVRTQPEQRVLDARKGALEESGNAPMRTVGELPEDAYMSAKSMISKTVEGRQLEQENNEYENLLPPGLDAARDVLRNISYRDFESGVSPEIGGRTYTNDELENMSYTQREGLQSQFLLEHDLSDEENQAAYDAQQEYLADHPQLAQYNAYKSLIGQQEGANPDEKAGAFAEQMRLSNPSFSQFYESNIIDHRTGVPDYGAVWGTDAFLASQGIRGSQYSPIVGNEPTTAPGGYPSIPGNDPELPLLPPTQLNTVDSAPVYGKPGDVTWKGKEGHEPVATALPDLPIVPIGNPKVVNDDYNGVTYKMVQVALQGQEDRPIGWIDASLLTTTVPPGPTSNATVPQPTGGLAALGGQASDAIGNAAGGLASGGLGAIGAGLGAVGEAVGGLITSTPQPPPRKPSGSIEGVVAHEDTRYGLSPWAENGAPADLINLVVPGNIGVGWDFRDPVGEDDYGNYFTPETGGHGTEHPGIDILGAYGDAVDSPVSGKVVCTGSGSGDSGVNGFGCAAFEDSDTKGVGKMEVQIDENKSLVFGHMNTADVAYGQQVNAGDTMGAMGGMNDTAHVHLEARLWNPDGTYTIVDPSLMLSGYYDAPQAASPAGPSLGDVVGGAAQGVLGALGGAKDALLGGAAPAAPAAPEAPSWQFSRPAGTYDHGAIDTMDTTTYEGQSNPRETITDADGKAVPNVQGIVYHFTASSNIASFAPDFTGQTGRKASSNYVVDKDGKIYQFVDPDVGAAWAQGDAREPSANGQFLVDAGGGDANQSAVSIEIVNEGNMDNPESKDPKDFAPYTPEQLEAVQNLTNYLTWKYQIPADEQHLVGHEDINAPGKSDPGPLFPMQTIISNAANPEMTAPKNPAPLAGGGYTPEMQSQIVPPASGSQAPEMQAIIAEPAPAPPSSGLGRAVSTIGSELGGIGSMVAKAADVKVPPPWEFDRPAGTYDQQQIQSIDTTTYAGAQQSPRQMVTDASGKQVPNVQGIVYHFTESPDIASFAPDFMGQTGKDTSANYVIDKDGKIYQFVDPSVGVAWAQGVVNAPNANARALIDAGGGNPNESAISIEIVNEGDLGHPGTGYAPYTPEQLEAVQNLTNYLVQTYHITPDGQHLVGHSDINSVDKRDPGPMFPLQDIIANAAASP